MADRADVKKVVLAYSGGLDTSVIVPWLKNNYRDCEVICFCADLGQEEELDGLDEKARASGASKLYVRDLREEFITDFVFPTLRAGAIYEREYLLGTSFRAPADRPASGRHCRARRGGCPGPWLHGQGQRSGTFRVDRYGAQPWFEGHCALARVEHPQP